MGRLEVGVQAYKPRNADTLRARSQKRMHDISSRI